MWIFCLFFIFVANSLWSLFHDKKYMGIYETKWSYILNEENSTWQLKFSIHLVHEFCINFRQFVTINQFKDIRAQIATHKGSSYVRSRILFLVDTFYFRVVAYNMLIRIEPTCESTLFKTVKHRTRNSLIQYCKARSLCCFTALINVYWKEWKLIIEHYEWVYNVIDTNRSIH